MRLQLAATSIASVAAYGAVNAGPHRACEQVSGLVDRAVRPVLANPAEPRTAAAGLLDEFRACLSSRNICSVVYSNQNGKETIITGDVTADLPQQYLSEGGKSSVMVLVRSVPRVRNDSNQYCLVSEKTTAGSSAQQWDVYGWVLAPNAREALPLQRQNLDDTPASAPASLRGLAAGLWFFAERMSGQSPP